MEREVEGTEDWTLLIAELEHLQDTPPGESPDLERMWRDGSAHVHPVGFTVTRGLPLRLVSLVGRGAAFNEGWTADGTATALVRGRC